MRVNQWKNSASVVEWFKNIEDKKNCIFIKFDIREFFPSITEIILDKTLLFPKQYHNISNDNTRLIIHYCKSLLFSSNEAWTKKQTGKLLWCHNGKFWRCRGMWTFGYLYLNIFLAKIINKKNCGLYRDDGLFILRNVNGQQMNRIRKKIIKNI